MTVRVQVNKTGLFCFLIIMLGIGIACAMLYASEHSGRVVATAPLWESERKNAGGMLQAYLQNSPWHGGLETRWIESRPLHLKPEDAPITLTILEKETGLVKKDRQYRDTRAELVLLHAGDRREVFHTKRIFHESSAKKREAGGQILPRVTDNLHLGIRTAKYGVGEIIVPNEADYVLLAGVDQWFLASSGQTLTVEARTGKQPPNPYQLAGGIIVMLLGMAGVFMTRDKNADSRHWKIKR